MPMLVAARTHARTVPGPSAARPTRARETNRAGMRAACVCVCAFPGGDGVIRQVKLEA